MKAGGRGRPSIILEHSTQDTLCRIRWSQNGAKKVPPATEYIPSTSQSLEQRQSCLQSCPKGKVLSGAAFSISQGLIKSSLLPSNYSNTMGLH